MSGLYVGLPGLGSAYIEVRKEWLGAGIERHEHDAEVWCGWLQITLSLPDNHPARNGIQPEKPHAYRKSVAACLGMSLLAFTGGVTASTMGERLTGIFHKVERAVDGRCLSQESIRTTSDWQHFTACNVVGRLQTVGERKVSGLSDDGHPIDFHALGDTALAIVDRDLIVTGADGFQRVRVPGVDQYAVDAVYQDNRGRLVLKGRVPDSDEAVRIRFEKIEEIEIDDVVISLR